MDSPSNQKQKVPTGWYQFAIVLVPLIVTGLLNASSVIAANSSVMIGQAMGAVFGQALLPMIIGLALFTLERKKLTNADDFAGMRKARNKGMLAAFIAVVVFAVVM